MKVKALHRKRLRPCGSGVGWVTHCPLLTLSIGQEADVELSVSVFVVAVFERVHDERRCVLLEGCEEDLVFGAVAPDSLVAAVGAQYV